MSCATILGMNSVILNNDIIEVVVEGNQTGASVQEMGDKIEALIKQQNAAGKPALVLDDVTKMTGADADARKLVVEFSKSLPYTKLAMVGMGGLVRLGANLLLQTAGRGAVARYFDNHKDALAWLRTS